MRTSLHVCMCAAIASALLLNACSTDSSQPLFNQSADGKTATVQAAPPGFAKVPDHYVVVLSEMDPNTVAGEVERIRMAHGFAVTAVYTTAIQGFSAFIPPGKLKKLSEELTVQRIEEDFEVSVSPISDKAKPGGTGPAPSGQNLPWGVAAVGGPFNGAGKVAWIIDTGIDPNHRDLTIDAARGANFVTGGKLPSPAWKDGNGHGTHVAGTIAAINNNVDVVGVAAGATVVPVRVLDNRGSGQYAWIIAGVDYVASRANPGDVANMSLGGPANSALNTAVYNAATTYLVKFALAAGNEAKDCSSTSPASVNGYGIYTVSAHDVNDVFASFSNYGPPVDICAPGVSVLSTKSGGGTTTFSGTSMASPHVAGLLLVGNVGSRGPVTGDKDSWTDGLAVRVP